MDDRMAEGVEHASAILMCFSKKYQESVNCKKEAQYASFCKKPIVPLKYDDHTPRGWLGILINPLLYHDVRTDSAMMASLPKIKEDLHKLTADTATKQSEQRPEDSTSFSATSVNIEAIDSSEAMKQSEDRLTESTSFSLTTINKALDSITEDQDLLDVVEKLRPGEIQLLYIPLKISRVDVEKAEESWNERC
ncbi:uncharacterized protein [Amphiura filiformis]|uniref:uncharacterized protein n=1 Tax=Amphiura filiformis TaxID=82378 RepID=UPI003B226E9E